MRTGVSLVTSKAEISYQKLIILMGRRAGNKQVAECFSEYAVARKRN